MLKIKNYYLLLLMSTSIVFADDGQTDTKVDLFKDWWLKNALQHPKSDSILSHFELQGSLNQSEGNYKSNTVRVSTRIDFRKDLYTLEILTKNHAVLVSGFIFIHVILKVNSVEENSENNHKSYHYSSTSINQPHLLPRSSTII